MPPYPRIPKSSPTVPYTLTQPSGHGAGEAGSQLDQAGRGSGMQMILTSFLEVWGLSPPLKRDRKWLAKAEFKSLSLPYYPLTLPAPVPEQRVSSTAGSYLHTPRSLACCLLITVCQTGF